MNRRLLGWTTRPRTGTVRELAGEDAHATSSRDGPGDLGLAARPTMPWLRRLKAELHTPEALYRNDGDWPRPNSVHAFQNLNA